MPEDLGQHRPELSEHASRGLGIQARAPDGQRANGGQVVAAPQGGVEPRDHGGGDGGDPGDAFGRHQREDRLRVGRGREDGARTEEECSVTPAQ